MKELEMKTFPQRVLRDMHSGVLVLDKKGQILYVNRPASKMLEIDENIEPGTVRFSMMFDNKYNDSFNEHILNALYEPDTAHKGHVRYMAPSGRKYAFRMSSSFLIEEDDKKNEEHAGIVITLEDETETEKMRQKFRDSSLTFSATLFAVTLWVAIYAFWEYLNRPVSVDYLTHGTEVLGLTVMFFVFQTTSLSWKDLGVTTNEPKKTVTEGIIIAIASIGLMAVIKLIFRLFDPSSFHPERPFIDFSLFGIRQITYIFTSGIQEFIARSALQGNIRRLVPGKYSAFVSILLSSMLFMALHIQHGFIFMVGAGILGGIEGILYERQQNIFGVWIVHWVFGVFGSMLSLIPN